MSVKKNRVPGIIFLVCLILINIFFIPVAAENTSPTEKMDKGLFTGLLNTISSGSFDGNDHVEDLLIEGKQLLANNSFLEAASLYQTILEKDPDSMDGWIGLAQAQSGSGNNEGALLSVDEMLFRHPKNWQGYLLRGSILISLSQFPEAVSSYQQALVRNDTDSVTWNGYGVALYWNGSYEEAIKALNQSLALEPENPSAHYWAGLSYQKQKKPEIALSRLNATISLDPHFTEAYLAVSNLFEDNHQYENALSVINQGIDNNPSSYQLWKRKGSILEELDRVPDATEAYQKALDINPNDRETSDRVSQLTGGTGS